MSQSDPGEYISFVMGESNFAARSINWLTRATIVVSAPVGMAILFVIAAWVLHLTSGITIEWEYTPHFIAVAVFCAGALIPILVTYRVVSIREQRIKSTLKMMYERHPEEYRRVGMEMNPEVWAMISMAQDVVDSAPPRHTGLVL